jgi:hypothetical protein
MVMTHEKRLELLQLARQAKTKKRTGAVSKIKQKAEPEKVVDKAVVEPVEDKPVEDKTIAEPVKTRKPRAKKEPVKTLTIEPEPEQTNNDDITDDVIVEIKEEFRKKPKKKIVKKIVYVSDSEDEIVEELVKTKPKKTIQSVKQKVDKTKPETNKLNDINSGNIFFNY